MADTISQLREQMLNLSNSRVGDTFIFAGLQNGQKPYTKDPVTGRISYRGDQGTMQLEIGEGSLVETTLQGASAFGGGSATASLSAGSTYTGEPSVLGTYNGSDNIKVTVTALAGGSPETVSYSVTIDDGFSVSTDDNGGAGYTLSELNTTGPLRNLGVQLRLPSNQTDFTAGDQVNLTLLKNAKEDVFALFDELELALREFDDRDAMAQLDYDGNGIADIDDVSAAGQAVIDANALVENPMVGNEL
jgi:flagellar hook-associated protein 3 FlgL